MPAAITRLGRTGRVRYPFMAGGALQVPRRYCPTAPNCRIELHTRAALLGFEFTVTRRTFNSFNRWDYWDAHPEEKEEFRLLLMVASTEVIIFACTCRGFELDDRTREAHRRMDDAIPVHLPDLKPLKVRQWHELAGDLDVDVATDTLVNGDLAEGYAANCITIIDTARHGGVVAIDLEGTDVANRELVSLAVQSANGAFVVVVEPFPWPTLCNVCKQHCVLWTWGDAEHGWLTKRGIEMHATILDKSKLPEYMRTDASLEKRSSYNEDTRQPKYYPDARTRPLWEAVSHQGQTDCVQLLRCQLPGTAVRPLPLSLERSCLDERCDGWPAVTLQGRNT